MKTEFLTNFFEKNDLKPIYLKGIKAHLLKEPIMDEGFDLVFVPNGPLEYMSEFLLQIALGFIAMSQKYY